MCWKVKSTYYVIIYYQDTHWHCKRYSVTTKHNNLLTLNVLPINNLYVYKVLKTFYDYEDVRSIQIFFVRRIYCEGRNPNNCGKCKCIKPSMKRMCKVCSVYYNEISLAIALLTMTFSPFLFLGVAFLAVGLKRRKLLVVCND